MYLPQTQYPVSSPKDVEDDAEDGETWRDVAQQSHVVGLEGGGHTEMQRHTQTQ